MNEQSKTEILKSKMAAEGLPELFINTFVYYYEQLVQGKTGLIPETDIAPVAEVPDAENLSEKYGEIGERMLGKTAVIKLNGGLGTSMGLQKAKALLPVKQQYSFLDLIAKQAIKAQIPLLLMNSFSTDDDSLQCLSAYPELTRDALPLSFLQHKEPKIQQSDMLPAQWAANPDLEWCPPGHGDIYAALVTSGALEALLENGYEYAFVSNADNLGAVMDTAILGYFADGQYPFMMEVADRTEMDRKGGHLALRKQDDQFILRESAQCPDEDTESFQDIARHKYFNTNNLWLNLPMLNKIMAQQAYNLRLALIRNSKTVDPRDGSSTAVYQLETAMGSAIGVFQGAQALRVPRTRFAPVKTSNDLLAVRSDAYELTDDFRIVRANMESKLNIVLDTAYYKFVNDLDARFPHGAPALKECTQFVVKGDFRFGQNVVCKGDVQLLNQSDSQIFIPDNTILSGKLE